MLQFCKRKDYSGLDLGRVNRDEDKWIHLRYILEGENHPKAIMCYNFSLSEAHT